MENKMKINIYLIIIVIINIVIFINTPYSMSGELDSLDILSIKLDDNFDQTKKNIKEKIGDFSLVKLKASHDGYGDTDSFTYGYQLDNDNSYNQKRTNHNIFNIIVDINNKTKILAINRLVSYTYGEKPLAETLLSQLYEKYGNPDYKKEENVCPAKKMPKYLVWGKEISVQEKISLLHIEPSKDDEVVKKAILVKNAINNYTNQQLISSIEKNMGRFMLCDLNYEFAGKTVSSLDCSLIDTNTVVDNATLMYENISNIQNIKNKKATTEASKIKTDL